MIDMTTLSAILYIHDPMDTQCNVNKNMEDEYELEAEDIIDMMKLGVPFKNALQSVMNYYFSQDCMSIMGVKAALIEADYYSDIQSYKL